MTSVVATAAWYFDQRGTRKQPRRYAFAALKWAFTDAAGECIFDLSAYCSETLRTFRARFRILRCVS
jgi:hypothetical protein